MTFRDFDKVPTFNEFGFFGILLRAAIWPFFVLTGVYLFISPSVAFFPLALGSFLVQIWCKFFLKKSGMLIQVYASCFAIALFVNGFTSYLRYTFPLILIIPILIMNRLRSENSRNLI